MSIFNNSGAQNTQNQSGGHGYQTRQSTGSSNLFTNNTQNNSQGSGNNLFTNNQGSSNQTQATGNNIFSNSTSGNAGTNIMNNNNSKPVANIFQNSGGSSQNIFQGKTAIAPGQNNQQQLSYRTQQEMIRVMKSIGEIQ